MMTFLILSLSTVAFLPPAEMDAVLAAIRVVESNNDPSAVGDNGKAIGVYQIWKPYWIDSRIPGEWKDCFDPVYADRVVRSYMKRYATEKRLGRPVTQQDVARIHNGGPNGYRKAATLKYWHKVQRVLKKQEKR